MNHILEAILAGPVTLATDWWHSRLIKANRPIKHGLWALIYAVLVAWAIWWLWGRGVLSLPYKAGLFAISCAIGRLVVFNISLNLFRGLSWTYVSPVSGSIIDKAELRLFGGRVWLFEVLAAAIFITLQFFL